MKAPKKTYKPKHGSSYDAIVVGGGLSGLLTSAFLLKKGRKVLLLEKLEKLGGRFSPEARDGFLLGAGFRFGDASAWASVADYLQIPCELHKIQNGGALLHSTRGWIEPEELPDWEAYYSANCTAYPTRGAFGIAESLLDFCEASENFSVALSSPVSGVTIQAARVHKISIGAEMEVEAKDLYWSSDYKALLESLRGEVAEAGPERVSWLKKFVKTPSNPAVVMEFAHSKKIGEFTESLIMPFTAGEKEERRYLVGALLGNRDPSLAPAGKELSSWIMPLTESEWGENHETMKKIRSARRLLEKALPGFESSILFDRVLVLNQSASPLLKKKGEWHPLLANLSLCADWSSPEGATLEALCSQMLHHFRD